MSASVKTRLEAIRARLKNGTHYDQHTQEAIERADKFFGTKLWVWALAEEFFGHPERGRRKGTRVWDGRRLRELAYRWHELKNEYPKLSDTKIAKIISEEPEFKEYQNHPELLRQRLADAKKEWDRYCTEYAEDWMAELARQGKSLDFSLEDDEL
jgi:hypothetical protein